MKEETKNDNLNAPFCKTSVSVTARVYARLGISETKFSTEAHKPQSCIYLVIASAFTN